MMGEDSIQRRLHLVASEKPPAQEELSPVPLWTDLAVVLAICIPFWAGLTWLVSAWL
jgi:hypothetical protein